MRRGGQFGCNISKVLDICAATSAENLDAIVFVEGNHPIVYILFYQFFNLPGMKSICLIGLKGFFGLVAVIFTSDQSTDEYFWEKRVIFISNIL